MGMDTLKNPDSPAGGPIRQLCRAHCVPPSLSGLGETGPAPGEERLVPTGAVENRDLIRWPLCIVL